MSNTVEIELTTDTPETTPPIDPIDNTDTGAVPPEPLVHAARPAADRLRRRGIVRIAQPVPRVAAPAALRDDQQMIRGEGAVEAPR